MLSFFPTLYPDETLYSGWARYTERVDYPLEIRVLSELFDNLRTPRFHFESRIDNFTSLLPANTYTTEYLINHHTLLPLYSIVLSADNEMQLREMMAGHGNFREVALNISSSRLPDFARYCSKCVKEDIKLYGEPYWHRIHQIPGIELCPHHSMWLKESTLLIHKNIKCSRPISARKSIDMSDLSPTRDEGKEFFALQEMFGHNALLLLENLNHQVTRENTNVRIRKLLIENDLASSTGYLYKQKIANRIRQKYLLETIKKFDIKGSFERRSWPASLIRGNSYFPLTTFFLLLDFLGINLSSFLTLSDKYQPFGEAPWLCYNPVCSWYRQPVIKRVNLSKVGKKDIGEFTCECGFTYRKYYSRSEEKSDSKLFIVSYGNVWFDKLAILLGTPGITTKQIAEIMMVSTTTIQQKKDALLKLGVTDKKSVSANKIEIKRKLYRRNWKKILEENPDLPRTKLRKLDPTCYFWLLRHDRDWYEKHSPDRRPNSQKKAFNNTNWLNCDADLVNKINKAAEELKLVSGRPIHITSTAIETHLGLLHGYIKRLREYLPLSYKVVSGIREPNEQYTIRLIEYKTRKYIESKKIPYPSDFYNEMKHHGDNPVIKKAILESIELAKKKFNP